jgi:hypothetical protein
MRIPSKHASPQAVVSLVRFWLQTVSPLVCGVSFERKRSSCPLLSYSETSFCGPRQRKCVSSWCVSVLITRNPS